jgi:phage shock protein PspC (stress-responsive transcriptional regulator)
MLAAEVPSPSGQSHERRLFRSRRSGWLGGVCAGLADCIGIHPGWLRAAFVLSAFIGGVGLAAYFLACVCIPMEPAPNEAPEARAELRWVLIGFVGVGTALLALLLLGEGIWVSFGGVIAPLFIAVACVVLRRGSRLERIAMLSSGLVLTAAFTVANYEPAVHDRMMRPTDSREFLGNGKTSVFSDLTIDLTALGMSSGFGTVKANSIFGDLTVILPKNAELSLDSTVLFSDVETFGRKLGSNSIGNLGSYEAGGAPVEIRLDVFSAFGSVKVVRQTD